MLGTHLLGTYAFSHALGKRLQSGKIERFYHYFGRGSLKSYEEWIYQPLCYVHVHLCLFEKALDYIGWNSFYNKNDQP